MAYVFQEFPKALYRKGAYMAVAGEAEEAAARAEGWTDYITDREGGAVTVQVSGAVPVTVVAVEVSGAPFEDDDGQAPEAAPEPAPVKRKPGRPPKAK